MQKNKIAKKQIAEHLGEYRASLSAFVARRYGAAVFIAITVGTFATSGGAHAQSATDFYKGKTLAIYSGLPAGGSYIPYARLLEMHISKHIPGNPATVLRIMEGGSSLTFANWLYNVAPKDGLAFGIFHERIGLEPLVSPRGTQFDGRKYTWIGSMAKQTGVCFTWHQSKVRTVEDAKTISIPVGSGGAAATDSVMPLMMNAMLGTKFQLVRGYSGPDLFLAMERGEIEGRCGFGWPSLKSTRPDWITEKKLNMLAQFSFKAHPDIPDVPLLMDMVSRPEDRSALDLMFTTQEMGRPFAAPPGIPEDRTAVLRRAFQAAVKDPALLADAKKQNVEIDPISGEEVTALLVRAYDTPGPIVERVNAFRGGGADGKGRPNAK